MPLLLEVNGLSRRFGNLIALDRVNFSVNAGEIYGVLGENGAGKSTLMHMLAGALKPDDGVIMFGGRPVRIASPRDAFKLGIGMVYQHFKLVGTLSAMENLALFASGSWFGRISDEARRSVSRWMNELGWQLDLATPVETLSVSDQQRVEIIKAVVFGGRLLILDEPTAALTPAQTDALLATVRRLAASGVTVLLISHKLAEIQSVCHRLLILRRGRAVLECPVSEKSTAELIIAMIGRDVELPQVNRANSAGAPVLELQHVTIRAGAEAPGLEDASLCVRRGEIVGLCGVEGMGRRLLIELLTGGRSCTAGRVLINGRKAGGGQIRRQLRFMGLIPEDRQTQGLILPWSVGHNLVLKSHRWAPLAKWGILRRGQWRIRNERLKEEFDIRTSSLQNPAGALSGGNQQKVILARELADNPAFLLAINPTRGLDVGATALVMQRLLAARDNGTGILLIHEDLDELLRLSDCVYVIYGRAMRRTPWPQATRAQIGGWMLGDGFAALPEAGSTGNASSSSPISGSGSVPL